VHLGTLQLLRLGQTHEKLWKLPGDPENGLTILFSAAADGFYIRTEEEGKNASAIQARGAKHVQIGRTWKADSSCRRIMVET